jgi:hypothetical protein
MNGAITFITTWYPAETEIENRNHESDKITSLHRKCHSTSQISFILMLLSPLPHISTIPTGILIETSFYFTLVQTRGPKERLDLPESSIPFI